MTSSTLFHFVNQKVESIVDAIDYNDSEILNEWEDLFDVHTVLNSRQLELTMTLIDLPKELTDIAHALLCYRTDSTIIDPQGSLSDEQKQNTKD